MGDEGGEMIEFDSLVDLISLFKYNCQFADRNELKSYLFNQRVIEQSLRQHALRKDKLYIDCEVLVAKLRDCAHQLGFRENTAHAAIDSYQDLANHILSTKIASVASVLSAFKRNELENGGMIGERELRRILADHL